MQDWPYVSHEFPLIFPWFPVDLSTSKPNVPLPGTRGSVPTAPPYSACCGVWKWCMIKAGVKVTMSCASMFFGREFQDPVTGRDSKIRRCRGILWNIRSQNGGPFSMGALFYPMTDPYVCHFCGNIYHQCTPHVSIYTIHGSYGYGVAFFWSLGLSGS